MTAVWTYFGPDCAPKTTTTLLFLANFSLNMLGDTILITCVACNLKVLKKSWQNLLKIVFWTHFAQKRGHYGPDLRLIFFFLAEITKADHQLSERFYFIKKSYFLTEFWLLSGVFCRSLPQGPRDHMERNANTREKNLVGKIYIPPGNENHLHILDMEMEKQKGENILLLDLSRDLWCNLFPCIKTRLGQ